jgi:hypothetical protein
MILLWQVSQKVIWRICQIQEEPILDVVEPTGKFIELQGKPFYIKNDGY